MIHIDREQGTRTLLNGSVPGCEVEVRQVRTRKQLQIVHQIVARGYQRLRKPSAEADVVLGELYPQASVLRQSNDTFMAVAFGEIVGTVRTSPVVESNGGIVSGSALQLFHSDIPWEDLLGRDPGKVSELGRFSIREDYLDTGFVQIKRQITLELFLAAKRKSERRRSALVAIMPPYTKRLTEEAGIRSRVVDGVRLATEDPAAIDLFETYPLYWHLREPKRTPSLYVFED